MHQDTSSMIHDDRSCIKIRHRWYMRSMIHDHRSYMKIRTLTRHTSWQLGWVHTRAMASHDVWRISVRIKMYDLCMTYMTYAMMYDADTSHTSSCISVRITMHDLACQTRAMAREQVGSGAWWHDDAFLFRMLHEDTSYILMHHHTSYIVMHHHTMAYPHAEAS